VTLMRATVADSFGIGVTCVGVSRYASFDDEGDGSDDVPSDAPSPLEAAPLGLDSSNVSSVVKGGLASSFDVVGSGKAVGVDVWVVKGVGVVVDELAFGALFVGKPLDVEIGRASCRERVARWGAAV